MDAINEGTTSSGPSWSAMLTGVWQDKHGVDDNSFNGNNYSEYPHFFKHVEDLNSELHTVSICQWDPINDQMANLFADVVINVSGGEMLVSKTVEYLSNKNPDAMFIHFDDVDGAGHSYGYSPDISQYLNAIEKVDQGIGEIITALKNRTTYSDENWLIIVSTDHGGIGRGHGGNSIEERNIFIICSGDEIPNIEVEKDSSLTTVVPPENCLKDSVELYFNGLAKVTTPLNSVFNFGTDKDFSIECRIRTENSGDVAIVTDKNWHTGYNKGVVFSFVGGGSGPWKVNIGDGNNRKDVNGNTIHDNEWHTLSATFDRDGLLVIYEDGKPVNSVAISSIGNIYSGYPISFGADALNGYKYKGHIAEIRIFSEILSPSAINNWSCKAIDSTHVNINSLIGYWRLTDGNNSDNVKDLSATKADGVISLAEWKDAKDTVQVWEYDYNHTPRQVDVAVSALSHLCIPIKDEWNLDGNAFGAFCNTETALDNIEYELRIKVYPNPGSNYIVFETGEIDSKEISLCIYNNHGLLVKKILVHSERTILKTDNLANGIYYYRIETSQHNSIAGKFVICQE